MAEGEKDVRPNRREASEAERAGTDRYQPGVAFEAKMPEIEPSDMMVSVVMSLEDANLIGDVLKEVERQGMRWGREHDRHHGAQTWAAILAEQVGKFAQESTRVSEMMNFPGAPAVPDEKRLDELATIIAAVCFSFKRARKAAERRLRRR